MDQAELHALEARCVHDAPPPCRADCPLGVDARGVLEAVAAGRFDDARKVLAARSLLPEILVRVCEEPCREVCPRESTGGSLRVREVEAACVAYGAEAARRPVPPRSGTAAVIGGGLAGMTAALDLGLRGYRVRLFEAAGALGGRLRGDVRVPGDVLAAAAARLSRSAVNVETAHAVDDVELELLVADGAVVCVACAGLGVADRDRVALVDVGRESTFIGAAAAGARAAAAVDLLLRGVASPAPVAPPRPALPPGYGAGARYEAAVIPGADGGFSREEAVDEASRCLRCACRECLDACLFLSRAAASPKSLLREINNNLVVTPGMGYRASKAIINACRLCGLCAEVCPAGIDFGEVCREARRGLCEREAMPPAVHEALLRDVAAGNGPGFALARAQPGTSRSRFAFFPGCQLPASRPIATRTAYEWLAARLDGGVALLLGCCGAPAGWAGRDDEGARALESTERHWESLGRPTLIVACPSCRRTLSEGRGDIPQVSLWEVLAEVGVPAGSEGGDRGESWPPLAVHDPCATRRDEPARTAVRRLLDASGCSHRDLPRSGRLTECCGFGGLQNAAAGELAAATLARQVSTDERDFVTTCAMCRDQFAAAGKPTWHLLDVLFAAAGGRSTPSRESGSDDAARGPSPEAAIGAGPGPTWSARRETRERFAREVLRDLWGEGSDPGPSAATSMPSISAALRRRLNDAFILESDVAAVVAAAERRGPRFAADGGDRLFARGRPGSVTYWVEYVRRSGGTQVRDVYSHRMEVLGVVTTATGLSELPSRDIEAGMCCEECGRDLARRPVRLTYLGATFDVELPACPSCGAVFVSARVAGGRMREVEMNLEDK